MKFQSYFQPAISGGIERMTKEELKGIIEAYHKKKDYDYYFEAICKEYNTRKDLKRS